VSKIVIIGIDGLDPLLLNEWRLILPNISGLYGDVSEIVVESTFPPDSIVAWTSIYTGESPAEHGLIESIDYLSGKNSAGNEDRSAYFRGKTFWDIAGDMGNKICIINPFIAYPAWKVKGVMVSGPVFEGGETSAYPESIMSRYKFPPLGGMVDFPDEKNLGSFHNKAKKLTEELAEISFAMYRDINPDLFFLTFLTLDRIKHFFWRFTDEEDSFYPGENIFKGVIKDYYLLFDRIIGRYIETLDHDTVLLVISDHGHRRRCSKCLNLNEILRMKGYTSIRSGALKKPLKKMVERAKVFVTTSLARHDLHDWIYTIAKYVPHRRALKKSTYLIDKEGSSATLANLCGTNPYGGIDIRAETKGEYERLRKDVTNELMQINETMGENIVKWVKKREQIYSGRHEKILPDILFELNEEYGVGMDLFTNPVTQNFSHKKISGGHKREAVLLQKGGNGKIINIQRPLTVEGIKDYILQILER
jgi:predicted AlkP superfamily phosphohydrolase/phosphomutase